jgi:hypothetical protein
MKVMDLKQVVFIKTLVLRSQIPIRLFYSRKAIHVIVEFRSYASKDQGS